MFYEEQLLVPLVVFDSVLENAVRIERVLNQPMGHVLLVGESGAGKTVLSRFVAWMEGLTVFQVPVLDLALHVLLLLVFTPGAACPVTVAPGCSICRLKLPVGTPSLTLMATCVRC